LHPENNDRENSESPIQPASKGLSKLPRFRSLYPCNSVLVELGFLHSMSEKPTKKAPAFQFYADDFLAGTLEMSQSDVGAYIRLLCHQWSRGYIPVETEKQQRLAGGSFSVDVLLKFQESEDGQLKNMRLEEEREKQRLYRESQSRKGQESAKKRSVFNNGSTAVQPSLNRGSIPVTTEAQPDTQPEGQPKLNSPSPSSFPISKTDINHDKREEGDSVVTVRWIKPSMSDLLEEASRIGLPKNEVEKFEAYYESNGWKVGKNKMKSWKHAMAGWKSRWQDEGLKGYGRQLFGTSTPDDAAF